MLSGASWWSPYETEKSSSALTPNLLSADLAAAMAATLPLTVLRPNSLSTFLWQLLDMLVVVESTLSGDTTGAVLTVCLGRTWCGMVKPLPVSPTMAGTSAAVILVIRLSRTTRATVGMVDTSLLAAATGSMKRGEPVLVVCFHRMLRSGSTAATFTDTLSFISSSTPRHSWKLMVEFFLALNTNVGSWIHDLERKDMMLLGSLTENKFGFTGTYARKPQASLASIQDGNAGRNLILRAPKIYLRMAGSSTSG